jgi:putative two-component system response regulator
MDPSAVKRARILIADDAPANVQLLTKLLDVSDFTNTISTTDSGAIVSLCAETEPDLIILDLHMPDPDGFEVMGQLSPWTRGSTRLPILVATADTNPETKRRALSAGARDFLTKPFDASELVARVENLLESRLLQLELRDKNRALEERIDERTRELAEAGVELLEPLSFAAEYRDEDARDHPLRVARASALLARELGLDEETAGLIGQAARLHDVGKLGLSDAVLLKPGRYTPDEFELMKTHTTIGAQILGRGHSRLLRTAAEIARTHHERWDGSGYPDGRHGEQIPMTGRIVALVDTFEALTHRRLYREAKSLSEAVEEIRGLAGSSFDPRVVSAFEALDHAALLTAVEDLQPVV